MKGIKTQLAALILGTSLALSAGASPQRYDRDDYPGLRQVVEQTQNDLRMAAEFHHGGDQRERYRHAQDDLSNLDRDLSKGHFNRDRMDGAIDKVKSVLEHNTLEAAGRDALRRDLENLRIARERHQH